MIKESLPGLVTVGKAIEIASLVESVKNKVDDSPFVVDSEVESVVGVEIVVWSTADPVPPVEKGADVGVWVLSRVDIAIESDTVVVIKDSGSTVGREVVAVLHSVVNSGELVPGGAKLVVTVDSFPSKGMVCSLSVVVYELDCVSCPTSVVELLGVD